jgi:hypothetical protein
LQNVRDAKGGRPKSSSRRPTRLERCVACLQPPLILRPSDFRPTIFPSANGYRGGVSS